MKVLLLGSGGREHALAVKLTSSATPVELFASPGSDAISMCGACLPYSTEDKTRLVAWAEENHPDLVVVGPEMPLVAGIADEFSNIGIPVFGHPSATAMLEGSKSFAKDFMFRNRVPCAASKTYRSLTEGESAINDWTHDFPIVIKADGLAAGKGVALCETKQEASETLKRFLVGKYGDASKTVVLEEPLFGMELSLHVLVDVSSKGAFFSILPACQDHKRLQENDKGPNTGGMGAFGPIPFLRGGDIAYLQKELVEPTVLGMQKDGLEGRGVLFLGVIWTKAGPKLLEYNVRFGDPETQVLMQLLDEDLPSLLYSVATHNFIGKDVSIHPGTALCLVLAAEGYPDSPLKGANIEINSHTCAVFHAGTKKLQGGWKVDGGRSINLVALGDSLEEAREIALADLAQICWPGMQVRRDIGLKALHHAKSGKTVADPW
jgi:phosphoribosylamine--glycine ligase